MSDAALHEANRRAHEVAMAGLQARNYDQEARHGHWFWRKRALIEAPKAWERFFVALDAYERLLAKEERISGPNG